MTGDNNPLYGMLMDAYNKSFDSNSGDQPALGASPFGTPAQASQKRIGVPIQGQNQGSATRDFNVSGSGPILDPYAHDRWLESGYDIRNLMEPGLDIPIVRSPGERMNFSL